MSTIEYTRLDTFLMEALIPILVHAYLTPMCHHQTRCSPTAAWRRALLSRQTIPSFYSSTVPPTRTNSLARPQSPSWIPSSSYPSHADPLALVSMVASLGGRLGTLATLTCTRLATPCRISQHFRFVAGKWCPRRTSPTCWQHPAAILAAEHLFDGPTPAVSRPGTQSWSV